MESHPKVARTLGAIGAELDQAKYRAVTGDAFDFLKRPDAERFDIVFTDPPFDQLLLPTLARRLAGASCLHAATVWYLESPRPLPLELSGTPWRLTKEARAGRVHFGLAEPACPDATP